MSAHDPWLVDGLQVARSWGSDAAGGLASADDAERLTRCGPNVVNAAVDVPARG